MPNGDSRRPPPVVLVGLHDVEIIEKARAAENGTKFAALWTGDTSAYSDDHSAADLALCNLLAFWTGCDRDRMDRLFRGSGLMRGKWDGPRGVRTYGAMTIDVAIKNCEEVYTGLPADPQSARTPDEATTSVPPRSGTATHEDRTPKTHAGGVLLEDFQAYMPMHKCIFAPSRELWPAASVNARIPPVALVDSHGQPILRNDGKPMKMRANRWLDKHQAVE